jgi:hypothetical protein
MLVSDALLSGVVAGVPVTALMAHHRESLSLARSVWVTTMVDTTELRAACSALLCSALLCSTGESELSAAQWEVPATPIELAGQV